MGRAAGGQERDDEHRAEDDHQQEQRRHLRHLPGQVRPGGERPVAPEDPQPHPQAQQRPRQGDPAEAALAGPLPGDGHIGPRARKTWLSPSHCSSTGAPSRASVGRWSGLAAGGVDTSQGANRAPRNVSGPAPVRLGLGGLRRGPVTLGSAQVTPRCRRWGRAGSVGVRPLRREHRRPFWFAGRREFPAAGPFRPVGLACSWWSCPVGPPSQSVLPIRASPEAAEGRSVQLPHCSGPGAELTMAEPESAGTVAPIGTPRSSRSGLLGQ